MKKIILSAMMVLFLIGSVQVPVASADKKNDGKGSQKMDVSYSCPSGFALETTRQVMAPTRLGHRLVLKPQGCAINGTGKPCGTPVCVRRDPVDTLIEMSVE